MLNAEMTVSNKVQLQSFYRSIHYCWFMVVITLSRRTHGFVPQCSTFTVRPFKCSRHHHRHRREARTKARFLMKQRPLQQRLAIITNEIYCPVPLELPVFPLRKSVKVPTESLTLNLYEPRYLAMADYILRDTNANRNTSNNNNNDTDDDRPPLLLFGAIYGSDKPQMVAGGVNPIVPIYEPGDVGSVFCCVQHSEEGVRSDGQGGSGRQRRRVQLRAVAIGRFRIERILHNGFADGVNDEASTDGDQSKGCALPFIVVEPSLINDDDAPLSSDERKRIQQLQERVRNRIQESKFSFTARNDVDGETETENEVFSGEPMSQSLETEKDMPCASTKLSYVDFFNQQRPIDDLEPTLRDELFSFAAILALIDNGSRKRKPKNMKRVLRMQSTLERLEYLDQKL